MTIAVFLFSLLGAMALGMPIAFALLVCGVALMYQLNMMDPQIIAQNLIAGADSFPLMAAPFFMLAGEIMNVGGLSKRIVNVALTLVGHVKGGLGYVVILASCILAALVRLGRRRRRGAVRPSVPDDGQGGPQPRASRPVSSRRAASSGRSFRRRSASSSSASPRVFRSRSCSWPASFPGS